MRSKQAKCPPVFVNMSVLLSQRGLTVPLVPVGQRSGWASHCACSIGAPSAPWTEERDSGQGVGTGEAGQGQGRWLISCRPPPALPSGVCLPVPLGLGGGGYEGHL